METSLTDEETKKLRSALNDFSAKKIDMKEIEDLVSWVKKDACNKAVEEAKNFEKPENLMKKAEE